MSLSRPAPPVPASFANLAWGLFVLAAVARPDGPPAATGTQPRPNVLVVIADDLGYGDLACYGSTTIATPRLDQLAQEGVRLDSFYVEPLCTPTRAAFLTGRYARRLEIASALGPWAEFGLNPSETTVAETLGSAGYRTALFGKWHVGDSPDQLPTAQGFDEFVGLPWGPTGIPMIEIDSRTGTTVYEPDPRTQTRRATDQALEFVDRAVTETPTEPFLCVVAYTAPHIPAACTPAFQGTSVDGRDYGDSIQEFDTEIGRLVDGVDALGIGGETLVLFFSDNGAATHIAPYDAGSNGHLRAGKGTTFEGGVRVPAIARWTGTIPPGTTLDDPFHVVDVLPTVAELAGATLPATTLDGFDISEVLTGAAPANPERFVHFGRSTHFQGVRRGRFKLRLGELFDLERDPGETTNLLGVRPTDIPLEYLALRAELERIEAEAAADPTTAGRTQRFVRRWTPQMGPSAPGQSSPWNSLEGTGSVWILEDADMLVDVVSSQAPAGFVAADGAWKWTGRTDAVRFVGAFPELSPTGPFTIAVRHAAPADGVAEPVAVLDIGDAATGLSITVGDAGLDANDAAPGQFDDVRVVTAGVTLEADLADGVKGFHLAVVRDEEDTLRLYVDGVEVASAPDAAGDAGLAGDWSLGAPLGELGGASAAVPPFAATRTGGLFGGVTISGRALRTNEVAADRCRYLTWEACHGAPNSTGEAAHLRVAGRFRPSERAMDVWVENAPPGHIAVLAAAGELHRTPFGDGYLCLGGPVTNFVQQSVVVDSNGIAVFDVPTLFDLPLGIAGTPLFLQVTYNDDDGLGGTTKNASNVVRVLYCAE